MRRLINTSPQVNSGTMADIAFLLLVFFLVSTTIKNDYGITSNISKPVAMLDSIQVVKSSLLLNKSGKLVLDNEEVNFNNLSVELVSRFDKRSAIKNILVIKTEREVEYSLFLKTLNETKKAFNQFYDDLALSKFNSDFDHLNDSSKLVLKKYHPIALVEDVIKL